MPQSSLFIVLCVNQTEKEHSQPQSHLQSGMLMHTKPRFRANPKAEPLIHHSFNWFQSPKKYFSRHELNLAATQGWERGTH